MGCFLPWPAHSLLPHGPFPPPRATRLLSALRNWWAGPAFQSHVPRHILAISNMWGPTVRSFFPTITEPRATRALRADGDRTPATSKAPVCMRHHADMRGPMLGLLDARSCICAHRHMGLRSATRCPHARLRFHRHERRPGYRRSLTGC
jgi:hypothetical protein